MNAAERVAAALLAGLLIAAAPLEADPHELYERARARLEAGRVDEAAALLQKLQALVAARPEWDPDGTFTRDLAPPLQARIVRLQGAASALDAFCDRALQEARPPDLKQDLSTVKDYTHWETGEVARLRTERDALVAQRLPNADDAALFLRTDSYARSERLLEVDLLAKMSDAAGDDILGLLSGDPRLESVLARFRQLKRDLIEADEEKDRLAARLKESEARDRALVTVLNGLLGGTETKGAEPADPGAELSRAVLARREGLLHKKGFTDIERALLDADLARYRLANRLIVAAGLGADQRGAIARLDRTAAGLRGEKRPAQAEVAAAPVEAAPAPRSRTSAWIAAVVLAGLAAAAVLRALVVTRSSNRPRSADKPVAAAFGDETVPLGDSDADRDAA